MRKLDLNHPSVLSNQKIIIYGAGVYGEIAYQGLRVLGLYPTYFCDRFVAGNLYFDIPVISPDEITNHMDAVILIASAPYFTEMREYLDSIGFHNYYDIQALMRLNIPGDKLSNKAKEKIDNIELYLEAVKSSENTEKLVLGHLELVVTEKCTLKCRDCANLMQYYKTPENIEFKSYSSAFAKFMNVIDRISELRILGGEPFISKDITDIIESCTRLDKIGKIVIYTNGTVIPNQNTMDALKNDKVAVHISDYNVPNNKIEKLSAELKAQGIKYFIRSYDSWNDLGNLEKRDHTNYEIKELYKNCVMANCFTFYRDKLYRCPRSAHGQQLGAFCNPDSDYVHIGDQELSDEDIKMQCWQLIKNKNGLKACEYCNGSNWHKQGIRPAIQLKG